MYAPADAACGRRVQESKQFFFEKRTKKLLRPVGCLLDENPTGSKSLLLLFFRKEGLPS